MILAIPAIETSSERVFLLPDRKLEDRRIQRNVKSVDGLLFIDGLSKLNKLLGLKII